MQRKLSVLAAVVASSIAAMGLQGCAAVHEVRATQSDAEAAIKMQVPPAPDQSVQTVNEPYLSGRVLHASPKVPDFLNKQVSLKSSTGMTVADVAQWVSDNTGIPATADGLDVSSTQSGGVTLPGVPSSPSSVTVDYTGTLNGLLNNVADKAGIWWHFDDGRIVFYKTETKTFQLPALAWSTNSDGSIVASSGASQDQGSSGGGSSTGTSNTVMKSSVDFWKGIENTAKAVGNGASIVADASTGSITVTGTPPQVEHVRQWVDGVSKQLSQQVAITIHVYSVKLNKEDNYGVNLTGAFQNVAQQYGFALTGAPAVTAVAGNPMSFGANILSSTSAAGSKSNEWTGSGVAVQALSSLGNVSQILSQSVVTLNGQPAPIQVAKQTVYLAQSSTTSTASVGSTNALTPGNLTTGFTALFLPHIADGKIYLGMNMTISNLDSIKTVTSGTSSIQTPETSNSTFQQSVRLQPGQSLLLTGFSQKVGSSTNNGVGSPYMPALGGGVDASTQNQMIAIVITARII